MVLRDLHSLIEVRRVISPAANANLGTTPLVGQIIDTRGFAALEFVISLGTLSDADAAYSVLLEDGDVSTLSDNVAIADSKLLGTEVAAAFQFGDDDGVRKIGVKVHSARRYVRMTITPTTTADSGNSPISVVAILAGAGQTPTISQADA